MREGIQSGPAPAARVDFVGDVQPIFARCYSCHGPQDQANGLRLDSRQAALQGGKSGPAIVSGKGAQSLLYRKLAGTAEGSQMPLGGDPLPPDQVELIRLWIDQGASWPEDAGSLVDAPIKGTPRF